MMWSRAGKRTFLQDANLQRYSSSDENSATEHSPGPSDYQPEKAYRQVKGNVSLQPLRGGRTEREKTLSNGVAVDSISPIGPGSYSPSTSPRARKPSVEKNKAPFGCTSPRNSGAAFTPKNGNSPGPGEYTEVLPISPKATSPRGGMSQTRRDVCYPVVKQTENVAPPRPPNYLHSSEHRLPNLPSSARANESSPGAKSRGSIGSSKATRSPYNTKEKGVTMSRTPRPLNMTNPNSALDRSRDSDYDNPPPGAYDVRYPDRNPARGRMSTTPRNTGMVVRGASDAPGPGSYFGGIQ